MIPTILLKTIIGVTTPQVNITNGFLLKCRNEERVVNSQIAHPSVKLSQISPIQH
jgi:hypothetical protein